MVIQRTNDSNSSIIGKPHSLCVTILSIARSILKERTEKSVVTEASISAPALA